MRLVVADTSPINYLLLIEHIDILPALFERVILPAMVKDELTHPKAPNVVRSWIAKPPAWIEICQTATSTNDASLKRLDAGESAAIILAMEIHADLLLMDDREGVITAQRKGLKVVGTLGLLSLAAQYKLLKLPEAFERLKKTNFHYRQEVMDQYLAESRDGEFPHNS